MQDFLRDYQYDAVSRMKNGCILNGGVGSGKSTTGLYYYFKENGGRKYEDVDIPMKDPQDLYIITTARKRDTAEWDMELARYCMSIDSEVNMYKNKIVVDSWNNIAKYETVKDAFFIFDEDKVTGYGKWAKTFIKITKSNDWIILSATCGDTWMDYISVFIANGFYKNKTDFIRQHVEYDSFCTSFPKIKGYHGTGKLLRYRRRILVNMDFQRETVRHDIDVWCNYNRAAYKDIFRNRWNYDKDEPIENAAALCYEIRKVVNSDKDRILNILHVMSIKRRVIIFYNFDYELEILREALEEAGIEYSEWNGHMHQDMPEDKVVNVKVKDRTVKASNMWAYLVQYNAGAEGWNCIRTDTIIFYSQNYSYKIMEQATGRIDRMNTPFKDLYYYHLKSRSPIDIAINKALQEKKKFNELKFVENS